MKRSSIRHNLLSCPSFVDIRQGVFLLLLALLLLPVQNVSAAGLSGLPAAYPQQFDSYGLVESVDLTKRTAVIDDHLVSFSEKSIILAPNRGEVTVTSLRPGQLVAYEITGTRNQRISELRRIWIMPSHISMQDMYRAQQEE